jgi:hypothetical protein
MSMESATLIPAPPETELVHEPSQRAITPLSLIQDALHKNTPPEVLKELVALQQSMVRFEWEAQERQAKVDFDNALNDCQRQIGRIAPNQSRTDTSSQWADYTQLDRSIRPIYTAAGFSLCFSEVAPVNPAKVRTQATLSRGGVSREYFRETTPSTTGPKGGAMATATDADAIAASRNRRYLVLSIFNIAIGIDADEKEGVPGLSMQEYAPLNEAIENAWSLSDVTRAYLAALKAAALAGDKQSAESFEKAAIKRKGELA